jgi:hypothetical protein
MKFTNAPTPHVSVVTRIYGMQSKIVFETSEMGVKSIMLQKETIVEIGQGWYVSTDETKNKSFRQ